MSADQRPAETAAHQHAADEAAETVSQLQAPVSNHAKAMDLPPTADAESKHLGGSDAGYPA